MTHNEAKRMIAHIEKAIAIANQTNDCNRFRFDLEQVKASIEKELKSKVGVCPKCKHILNSWYSHETGCSLQ